jgi:hypothetical protein
MAMTEHISGIDTVTSRRPATSLSSSIRSLARFFTTWASSCADYYAAAAMYEQLSRLSNAELQKRGLSRDTLARDLCRACDRTADR